MGIYKRKGGWGLGAGWSHPCQLPCIASDADNCPGSTRAFAPSRGKQPLGAAVGEPNGNEGGE